MNTYFKNDDCTYSNFVNRIHRCGWRIRISVSYLSSLKNLCIWQEISAVSRYAINPTCTRKLGIKQCVDNQAEIQWKAQRSMKKSVRQISLRCPILEWKYVEINEVCTPTSTKWWKTLQHEEYVSRKVFCQNITQHFLIKPVLCLRCDTIYARCHISLLNI
jgi:hypothetical protein